MNQICTGPFHPERSEESLLYESPILHYAALYSGSLRPLCSGQASDNPPRGVSWLEENQYKSHTDESWDKDW